jgi:hypothetical protein
MVGRVHRVGALGDARLERRLRVGLQRRSLGDGRTLGAAAHAEGVQPVADGLVRIWA